MVDKMSQYIVFNDNEVDRSYWMNQLKESSMSRFCIDYLHGYEKPYRRNIMRFKLPNKITNKIFNISRKSEYGTYLILLSGVVYLLHKYTMSEDVLIGTPTFKQEDDASAINDMLAFKSCINRDITYEEYISQLKNNIIEMNEHQDIPLEIILEELGFKSERKNQSIFNTIVLLENIQSKKEIENIQADMIFSFNMEDDSLELKVEYNENLYTSMKVNKIIEHLFNFYDNATENTITQLTKIKILCDEEREKILNEFNNSKVEYDANRTICCFFEEQVKVEPNKPAVIFKEKSLTYIELNKKANQLARTLYNENIGKGSIVAIITEPCIEMFIGIMAIVKVGAAFIPIDPNYPESRIRYILEDSNAKLILTQRKYLDTMSWFGKLLDMEDNSLYNGDSSNLNSLISGNDLAYIIYTSGTTGNPKGVMIGHKSLVNLCMWHINNYNVTNSDKVTKYANMGFDASVWEIIPYLVVGATIFVISDELKFNINMLNTYFEKNNITISFLPTQICEQFMSVDNKSLRLLLTGGDKLKSFIKRDYDLINNYGPTENTVVTTSFKVDKYYDNIPIGKPVYNTRIYIVDKNNDLQPIGVAGELCIAGDGLAKGYLNNQELTESKFVKDLFVKGERVYKTGDLARWLPDGNIEFLGRIDHQVKVRGYRIELAEIEANILKHEEIKDVVVLAKNNLTNNEKYLCAYFISDQKLSSVELKQYLMKLMPKYMIPNYFIQLESIPITANGKADKNFLLTLNDSVDKEDTYVLPTNDLEQNIENIWTNVLGLNKVSIKDNFFEVGGHSIAAMQIISKIKNDLNFEINFKDFAQLGTIEKIAGVIEKNKDKVIVTNFPKASVDRLNLYEPFPLTEVQKAYLVGRNSSFEMGGVSTHLYLELESSINIERLNIALQKVINRHPMMRAIFLPNGQQQVIRDVPKYVIDVVDISHLSDEEKNQNILKERERMSNYVFKADQWPLYEFKVFKISCNIYCICIGFDALIADGGSMQLIANELIEYYMDTEVKLPEVEFSFRDYVLAYEEFKNSQIYKESKKYWLDKVDNFPMAAALPLKMEAKDVEMPSFRQMRRVFNREEWNILKNKAQKHGITPSTLLTTVYAEVLAFWSNQPHHAINLTVFNRLPFHEDVDKVVGDFTSIMLLDIDLTNGNTFWQRAKYVQDVLIEAMNHRYYDGVEFIREIVKQKNLGSRAAMPIVFTSALFNSEDENTRDINEIGNVRNSVTQTSQVYIDNKAGINTKGQLVIEWDYVEQIFDLEIISGMFDHYIEFIHNIIISDKDYKLTVNKNYENLVKQYNCTEQETENDTLDGLFYKQVIETPDNIAVKFEKESITYRELHKKSNQVANFLISKGIVSNDFVGLIAEPCIETIVNMLGILKVGAAYVPIDPDYPEERKLYIIKNNECKLVLYPEVLSSSDFEKYPYSATRIKHSNENIAYVIYTSGSTGNPKGVIITHDAVVNTIIDINRKFGVNENDKIMAISSMCFDLSVYDIFGALSSGATLVLIKDRKNILNLINTLDKEGITIWNSVPAIMDIVVNTLKIDYINTSLRLVLLSGDWIGLNLPKKIKENFKESDIISLGGATEASIWSIYYPIKEVSRQWKSIPYGMPLANQKFYVLNYNMELCPIGVEGELYIGGKGLAKGYFNDIEKTKNAFIKHDKLGELYKTGDYGIFHENGYIEFTGRKDYQVKINGYRIELGEIQKRIADYSKVKNCIVIDRIDSKNEKYICAYLVSNEEVNSQDLKDYLIRFIPEYMIPKYFIQINEIPLTANGKINRKELPEPIYKTAEKIEYAEPRDYIERAIADIWKEVFEVEKVGIYDNFFDLGPQSLKAVIFSSKLQEKLNVEVTLMQIFERPTIEELANYIRLKEKVVYSQIEPTEIKEYYPMSSAQKRLFILNRFDKNSLNYNIPISLLVEGNLEYERVNEVFNLLIKRHESLRTYFEIIDEEPVQKILGNENVKFNLEYVEANEIQIKDLIEKFSKPFDLINAPLIKGALIKQKDKENRYVILLDIHHIILDGLSKEILVKEFKQLYNGEILGELRIQYKDFAVWQNKQIELGNLNNQEEYWLSIFNGEIPVLNMPTDFQRMYEQEFEGDEVTFEINSEQTKSLRKISEETGATMYMVLLAAYNILLSKYTGQNDIIVGSPTSGRRHADLENIIGMFVNTLAMRNYPEADKTFKEFLLEVKNNSLLAFENQDYQFERLVDRLNISRDISRNPLFDTIFLYENVKNNTLNMNDISITYYGEKSKISKFDMTLGVMESEDKITFAIEYCTKLYKKETIEKLAIHFKNIIKNIVCDTNIKLGEIDMLSEEECRMLKQFSSDNKEDLKGKTIHELFEEQVERTPENIAITFKDENITYRQVNEKANQLARMLRKKGVEQNIIVGIMATKSIEFVVGVLAILKAGGAYLPISPQYPTSRIEYILENSETKILLTDNETSYNVSFNGDIILLNEESLEEKNNLDNINSEDDSAYVIYTSGSMGKPKGVVVGHKSLNNFINAMYKKFDESFNEKDKCLSLTNISFDVSVGEIFTPICCGATLVIYEYGNIMDIHNLAKTIIDNKITFTYIPPTILKELYSELKDSKDNLFLNKILVGVEPIKDTVLEDYKSLNNEEIKIINGYGPTEATICATMYKYEKISAVGRNVPIGKPLMNNKIYIVDKQNNMVPIGVPGELCISGYGLAKGYIHVEEYNKDKFVVNPFDKTERLYKTGDLAKWLSDGNIEFLGRVDNQVKIRGFRIELGEIECQLLTYEGIKEAVVIDRESESGEKYLCAYVVANRELKVKELRTHLAKNLPEYMIPYSFAQLDNMPITPNGKLDRRGLPKPNLDERLASYEAPRNAIEEILVRIWSEVLGIEKIGINDSFFELGGHSLKAMTLIAKIHKETNKEVPVKELFKSPTIKQISEYIFQAEESKYAALVKAEEREYYPLSPTQLTFFLVNENEADRENTSIPLIARIKGEVSIDRLQEAFRGLIARHEAFRTSIEIVDDQPVFKIHKDVDFNIEYKEISEEKLNKSLNEYIQHFDLAKPPLMRVWLIKTGEKQYALFIVIHHIIMDGYSINILQKELLNLYQGIKLPEKKYDYRDYLVHHMKLLKSEMMEERKEYWLNQFEDGIPILNIPTDVNELENKKYIGQSLEMKFSKEYTKKLIELANKEETTLHMLIFSLYAILLNKYSGQNDIVIGSISAGRDLAECENIIGAFINVIPVRVKMNEEDEFIGFLRKTRDLFIKAYENQYFSFDTIKEKKLLNNDLPTGALFNTLVNFHTEIARNANLILDDMIFEPYNEFNYREANLDIQLDVVIQDSEELQFVFEYNANKFKRESIERLLNHFSNIADQILIDSTIQLSRINMLSESEKKQLLIEFNNTDKKYDFNKSFIDLFEEQVELIPEKIAVICNKESITYRDLNEKSNQLARVLKSKGVAPNKMVGIMVDRSINMIISVLGVLKSGSAYVPIDIEYPEDRIKFIIEDANINLIVTQEQFKEKCSFNCEIIDIEDAKLSKENKQNLSEVISKEDLAYVIYTSGTTGKPKGVLVKHVNLTNAALGWKECYELDKFEVKLLQVASISFDVFVGDLARALINGGQMVICPTDVKNDFHLLHLLMMENNISILESTPSLIGAFMDFIYDNKLEIPSLKILIMGSDICSIKEYKKILSRFGENTRILNSYGVTEATIDSSYYEEKFEKIPDIKNTPIGKPMPNVKFYILDKNRNVQPIGIPGELYIGGLGVAQGYLNREDLTEQKFVEDITNKKCKMYKTGDLARWLEDGNVEFLGRTDNQVKIRGYRIELSEIENALLEEPIIEKAVVTDKQSKSGDKYLCAYVISKEIVDVELIKEKLKKNMPQYMVPQYIFQLEKLPITFNGKVDMKALPFEKINKTNEIYVEPINEIEVKLCDILKDLLKVDQISMNDNFFNLGGNSLKAILFLTKIHKKFNVKISINDLFENPYVKNIAQKIASLDEVKYPSMKQVEEREYYVASFAQKRIYPLAQLDLKSTNYNIPITMTLEGKLELEKIQKSFKLLIERHESLRTTFEFVNDDVVQKIHRHIDFNIEYREVSQNELNFKLLQEEFIKPFNLNKGPLIRAQIVKVSEEKYVLLVDVHHIIADGKSIEILISEFVKLYEGMRLVPLTIQYKDFSEWQNECALNGRFNKEEQYWLDMYKGRIPKLNMPLDFSRPNIQSFEGDRVTFELGEVLTKKLTSMIMERNVTKFMVLFASYATLIANYTCDEDLVIGVPIVGRNYSDLESVIGMFVNTLAIRVNPEGSKTFKSFLFEIKEILVKSYENQDFEFEKLIEKLNFVREAGRNPLFDVAFNFRTDNESNLSISDVNIEVKQSENKVSKFDFSLNAFETKNNIYFELEYCTKLFKKDTMEKLAEYYIKIINTITENIDINLNEIDIESFENQFFEMEELEFNF